MKKCPKCMGKGAIMNYSKIDGGICYECNGKKYVSDNHQMYKKPQVKTVPDWIKQKENKIMQDSHEKRVNVINQIHEVIGGKKGLAREFFEMMTGEEQKQIAALNDGDFTKYVEGFYIERLDELKDYCPEYF